MLKLYHNYQSNYLKIGFEDLEGEDRDDDGDE